MATNQEPHPSTGVHREIEVGSDPDDVWEVLTDDDERAGWFGSRSALDPTPGGEGWFEDEGGSRREVRVDEAVPGRRLAWTWWPESGDDPAAPPSRVEIDLTELPGGTRISVTETPLAPVARACALTGPRRRLLDLELHILLRSHGPVLLART